MYDYKHVDATIELDACLTGFGGCWKNFVYNLPIPLGYRNMNIVHLEMLNIFLSLNLFKNHWKHIRVLVKCDNEAVVTVLNSGHTRDPFLGALKSLVCGCCGLSRPTVYTHKGGS